MTLYGEDFDYATEANDRIGIDYSCGKDMTLGVKADSLIDELSRIIEPTVTIHFTDPSRAVTHLIHHHAESLHRVGQPFRKSAGCVRIGAFRASAAGTSTAQESIRRLLPHRPGKPAEQFMMSLSHL